MAYRSGGDFIAWWGCGIATYPFFKGKRCRRHVVSKVEIEVEGSRSSFCPPPFVEHHGGDFTWATSMSVTDRSSVQYKSLFPVRSHTNTIPPLPEKKQENIYSFYALNFLFCRVYRVCRYGRSCAHAWAPRRSPCSSSTCPSSTTSAHYRSSSPSFPVLGETTRDIRLLDGPRNQSNVPSIVPCNILHIWASFFRSTKGLSWFLFTLLSMIYNSMLSGVIVNHLCYDL